MVICPECGYPYEDEAYTIGERNIQCANCSWSGSSSKLIAAPEAAPVDKLQELFRFLGKDIGPQIGVRLVKLGLLTNSSEPENVAKIARVLQAGARGAFRGLVTALFTEEVNGEPN